MTASHATLLITGASGAVGSRVVRAFRAGGGRPIVVASRSRQSYPDVAGSPCTTWHLDLLHGVTLPEDVRVVLHIAGEKRDEHRMWEINHQGTRRLIEAAARAGVRRFVHVSSVGVYGARMHAGLVEPTFARAPGNVYESSKAAAEDAVREMCPALGMEFVIVQPSNVLARFSAGVHPLLGFMSAIRSGRLPRFGAVDAWLNYVDVDDVAAALVAAVDSGSNGSTYIVNTPERLSVLTDWIVSEFGVAASARRLPAWLGALMGQVGSVVERVTGRSMPFNNERYRELTNTTVYDGEGMRREFGFRYPVGIEASIRALVNAYAGEGLL